MIWRILKYLLIKRQTFILEIFINIIKPIAYAARNIIIFEYFILLEQNSIYYSTVYRTTRKKNEIIVHTNLKEIE